MVIVAPLVLAVGCGDAAPGGSPLSTGGASGGGLPTTGSAPSVPGTSVDGALTVTAVHPAPAPARALTLVFDVAAVRAPPVTIAVEVSNDGQTYVPATLAANAVAETGGDGITRVTTTWRSIADLGLRWSGKAQLRVVARDARGASAPAGFAVEVDNLRVAARAVDRYMANYGEWPTATVEVAKHYDLAIVHPGRGKVTRDLVAAIQAGVDPVNPEDDVLVLCYVSVGEDLRGDLLSDDQIRADPRFRGDGTGPRIDPRGAGADGATAGGHRSARRRRRTAAPGFASYYLDDNDVHNSANHVGDGFPDRNGIFHSMFVNAGDPAWFDVVDAMTIDSADRVPGLREVLTPNYGRGLDCDGVFLDTIDTAAPNSYTSAASANQSEYEWTAPGFGAFIRRIHDAYPARLILQNRGVFFFDPRRPQYAWNPRGAIDFLLFESFRLDSNTDEEWDPIHYPENRYNAAPKLMAEANRPDGFTVLSLGYAAGPADRMSSDTLTGASMLGYDSLLEDIHVTEQLHGMRHYLTDSHVSVVNDFVRAHGSLDDAAPPRWSSTYNDHGGTPAGEPTPRVGIQAATPAGGGQVTVKWDVALDLHRVSYVLYAQPTPFDFAGDPKLSQARRVPLVPSVPPEYVIGVGPGRFAHQAVVSGLPAGQMQFMVIRAVDAAASANEDDNRVMLTVTP